MATRGLILVGLVLLTVLGVRAHDARSGPPLEPWHTYVPEELTAEKLDAADWDAYLAAEDRIFASLRTEVSQRLDAGARVPINRYFEGSPVYPPHLEHDWNRSYLLEPDGKPAGAVVFLHGLTDSPYSMRHMAARYRAHGFVSIAIRLPAHGTVPGALTDVEWEDWMAATRLAVREARRRTDPGLPLHLVGYSNGGALAMKYALDALEDGNLARPVRVVLLSPMIGVTRFARFAGLAGLPAVLPAFARAAWLFVLPEFNPFKYNSFPVNAARQSYRLTDALQRQIVRLARDGRLLDVPPVLTFQSVIDFTVSTPAILSALYAHLPANGSELVLFDVNRTVKFGPLLRPASHTAIERLLPPLPQRYRITVIGNPGPDSDSTVERTIEAGDVTERSRPLGLPYPPQVFSLSHVAIPFPMDDGLYGMQPDPAHDFGIRLGTLVARGERGTLVVDMDFLSRMNCNPFFPHLLRRIEDGIDRPPIPAPGAAAGSVPRMPDEPPPTAPPEPLEQPPVDP